MFKLKILTGAQFFLFLRLFFFELTEEVLHTLEQACLHPAVKSECLQSAQVFTEYWTHGGKQTFSHMEIG